MRFAKSVAFILTFLTLSFSQNTFDVLYDSDSDIGGFQFSVTGIEGSLAGNAASGGDAAANGFTTSAGGTTVLGFSFSGGVIPAGSGVLTTVDIGDNDKHNMALLKNLASLANMPLTIGGKILSTDTAKRLYEIGADKLMLRSYL